MRPRPTFRFGPFQLDATAVVLRKKDRPVRLAQKPFQALQMLLERPGEAVRREELQGRLWGADTFVDSEDSLNHVIKRIRDALDDSAENPRFIETVTGVGYRFVGPLKASEKGAPTQPSERTQEEKDASARSGRGLFVIALLAVVTTAVFGALWLSEGPADTSSPAVARTVAAAKPTVAVLPFTNLSGEPDDELFADGLTDILTGVLANVGALRVISRTSTAQYKGVTPTLPEIARDLNATHVVEGGVLQDGDRLRITAQLIEAATDSHLWAETYEESPDDILLLQSELALSIAKAIQVELTPEEEARLAAVRPVKREVYETYLKARAEFDGGRINEAIALLEKTIAMDPDYAPAHSWLASCHISLGWWTGSPAKLFPAAKNAALRARKLDDTLADPHLLLGKIHAYYEWRWAAAEKDYLRALKLNPNHVRALVDYAHYLLIVGRRQEALQFAARALELDPLSPMTIASVGDAYYFADQFTRAIELYQNAARMAPDGYLWHAMLGCVYTDIGNYDEAVRSLERALPSAGQDLRPQTILAWTYARAGNREKALEILGRLRAKLPARHASHYSRAFVYAGLGDLDLAFSMLEEAIPERWPFLGTVAVIPPLDPLRSDSRYRTLLKRIGLEDIHFPETHTARVIHRPVDHR